MRRRRAALLAAVALAGCYHVGYPADPLLLEDDRALAVPIFHNHTLRRGLEHALTRELRRELLETTPLHLAPLGRARRVLRGSVDSVQEGLLIAGPVQEVVHSSVTVVVRCAVYARDPDGPVGPDGLGPAEELVLGDDTDGDGRPDAPWTLLGYAEFTPSRGESRDTAAAEALRDVAEMIALHLQGRHDDRFEPNDDPGRAALVGPGEQAALIQREEDWFRLAIPAGTELTATVYFARGDLRLAASDASGQPLPDAAVREEGRIVAVPGLPDAERPVWLRVAGDDSGASYRLVLRVVRPAR